MKAKKYIKRVLLSLLLLVLAAGLTVGGLHVWNRYQEKKRLAQKPYFTEKKISYGAMAYMTGEFHCESSPRFTWDMKEEDWPDYSHYTLEATGDTKIVVTVLNYILFEDLDERDRKASELAKQYGFSAENPITVDWVMEHPEDAVEIVHISAYGGADFRDKDYIYSMYEKITGKQVETEDDTEEETEDERKSDVDSDQAQGEEDWTDYNENTTLVKLGAEDIAKQLNYWLFEDFEECDRKALELAEQYGFSAENPVTETWIVGNPEAAVEIMQLTQDGDELLRSWHYVFRYLKNNWKAAY